MGNENFVNVQVNVGGRVQNVKIEKGCSFSNNDGEYCVLEDGTLKFRPSNGNVWQDAKQIEMSDTQWQVFHGVSNFRYDDVYSKRDIQGALQAGRSDNFERVLGQDLPDGFKISRQNLDGNLPISVNVQTPDGTNEVVKFSYTENDAGTMPVKTSIPDSRNPGRMIEFSGKGTVTNENGLTTTTISSFDYGDDKSCIVDSSGNLETPVKVSVTTDESGKVVSSYTLILSGEAGAQIVSLTNYTYDDAGNVVSETCYSALHSNFQYSFDGTEIEHYICRDGRPIEPTITNYEYDDRGNMLRATSEKRPFRSSIETTYHDDNSVATYKTDVDGDVTEIHYDRHGNVIFYDRGYTDSTGYDNEGFLVHNGNTNSSGHISEYDSQNRLIKRAYTRNGEVQSIQYNTYNADGTLSQSIENNNGEVIARAENGNLIYREVGGYSYEYQDGVCVRATLADAFKEEITGLSLDKSNLKELLKNLNEDVVVSVITAYNEISPEESLDEAVRSEYFLSSGEKRKISSLVYDCLQDLGYDLVGNWKSAEATNRAQQVAQHDTDRIYKDMFD